MSIKTEQWQWSADKGWDGRLSSETITLGESAQVVFLFGSTRDIKAGRCFDVVRTAYPHAHLFGCTTAGEIHGTHVTDRTVVITAATFENTYVACTHVQIPDIDRSFETGEQLVKSLDAHNLRHIFVLSEGLQVNGSKMVQGINSALPDNVTVSGGFAGDGNRLQETAIWYDGVPEQSSVAALAFYGDRLQVGMASSAGWDPFGPDRLITKSKDNVLYECDGLSALNLYKQYLGEYAQSLPASGLLFPLALRIGESENRVMRALLAVNEEDQSITFAGNVPEGSYVRLMRGHIENLIDGAQVAASSSIEKLGSSAPQFSILVSCNGRRPVLKQRIEEEVEAVNAVLGDQATLTGFYSYGEIAPIVVGGQSELHNQTMTITSFAEI
ncbi:MAG TPA: FIST N-terminal domain-containing protein [Ktedonobacteraceae bacterium]